MDNIVITKDKFRKYLEVQIEGKFNMYSLSIISNITGLSKNEIRYIQNNYKSLNQKFPGLKQEISEMYFESLSD